MICPMALQSLPYKMKRILLALFAVSFSAHAQVTNYNYLEFCNQVVANTDNSIQCLHTFYKDLKEFKKNRDFTFRNYDSYNCIAQPDQKSFDRIKAGTSTFYKPLAAELWELYNSTYTKGDEIVVFIRLQDFKTDLEKGFRLIREMQQLQTSIAEVRNKIANKIIVDAKSLAPDIFTKPYQVYLNAIVHEEELIRNLSQNFNEGTYTGFAKEEILKSMLETDELMKTLRPSNFKLADMAALKSCYEGFELIQKTKQTSLNNFNNTSTFNGEHANNLYGNLLNYFNTDILYFFAYLSAQGSNNGKPLSYYPMSPRRYDLDAKANPWVTKRLEYSPLSLDSIKISKQPSALPVTALQELDLIISFINESIFSLEDLYKELRSQQYLWENLYVGKMPYKNPVLKFDRFRVPMSEYGLVTKNSKNLPAQSKQSLMKRVDDLQQIMLVMQDRLIGFSQYMSAGSFRGQSVEYIDSEVKTFEQLYTEFDLRKENLYKEVRKVYYSYPPAKSNSWIVASARLLKAADDSRKTLRRMELRFYENDESPVSTTSINDDRRDLITNELKYMKGIVELGKNNGNCPYTPYEYIPDYLKTIEEKVQGLPAHIEDKDKKYSDFLYMHNLVIERYNKFAELGLGDNEYGKKDPARPVYILSDIYQLMKYHFDPPKPEEQKKVEPAPINEVIEPEEVITFEGYRFNNIVLLLDVSSSMNTPERLPELKKSFQQLIRLMRKEDEVSIVTYSGKAIVLLPPTSARDTTKILRSIQDLTSDGKTNIADGLSLAYKTARKNFKSDSNNRIILATDGEFNTGESLFSLAEKNSAEIPLTVFDFSQRTEPIKSIQMLAERGKGNYVKVTKENSLAVLVNEARTK